jgi:hypothetical protein
MNGKWSGWVAFGAILMMVVGVFKFISGIVGLFNDEWLVSTYSGYLLVDITGLAAWTLIVGVVLVLGGMAAMAGRTWGRVVGVIAAGLAVISEFFMIPYHPVWSVLMIVLYVFVLVAFIAWKGPARSEY